MLASRLRESAGFLQRRWLLLMLLPVLAAAAAYVLTSRGHGAYAATATVLVNPATFALTPDQRGEATYRRLTDTYARLVTRPVVLDEVRARLPLWTTNDEVERKLSIEPVGGTLLLHVRATDGQADTAASLANTVAAVFAESSAVDLLQTGAATVVVAAPVPASPEAASPRTNAAIALAAALAPALALGLLLDRVRRPSTPALEGWPPPATSKALKAGPTEQAPSFAGSTSHPAPAGRSVPRSETPMQDEEVSPPAITPSRPLRTSGTTMSLTPSGPRDPFPGLRGSFLKDEDLRPNISPSSGFGPWGAQVTDTAAPNDAGDLAANAERLSLPPPSDAGPVRHRTSPPSVLSVDSPLDLSETMVELMSRLDETVEMIRALRPSKRAAGDAEA